jgi:gamma-glutamylcyclotransferase (GGCT)/AIG2-like uncharacterized protein YtfP
MHSVFAYGTLQNPRILSAVIQRVPRIGPIPCTAKGLRVYPIEGEYYPAGYLVNDQSVCASGTLWRGLSDKDLELLDRWEGDEYTRECINVCIEEDQKVWVYVYCGPKPVVHNKEWKLEEFEARDLDRVLLSLLVDSRIPDE